jgi:hypothetical protein
LAAKVLIVMRISSVLIAMTASTTRWWKAA